jgi:glycosyltransferase involved in cell wall biosynthesis
MKKEQRKFLRSSDLAWLFEPVGESDRHPITLSRGMYFVWLLREDLRSMFDINAEDGLLMYFCWWVLAGQYEYRSIPFRVDSAQMQYLNGSEKLDKSDEHYPISRFMLAVWRLRSDLQERFHLSNVRSRRLFWSWFLCESGLATGLQDEDYREWLREPAGTVTQDLSVGVTRALFAVWLSREDLQAAFPLDERRGRLGLVEWWLSGGHNEHRILALDQRARELVTEPDPEVEQDVGIPIGRCLKFVWLVREDLQAAFPLDERRGRLGLVEWWLSSGHNEHGILSIDERARHSLLGTLHGSIALSSESEDRSLETHVYRQDVLARPTPRRSRKRREFSHEIEPKASAGSSPSHQKGHASRTASKRHSDEESYKTDRAKKTTLSYGNFHNNGVNIMGFVKGELGIGEDVRMMATAFSSAEVPFCLIDAPLGLNSRARDMRAVKHQLKEPAYDLSIYSLPTSEMIRIVLEDGPRLLLGRYNIGFWQWELPRFPAELADGFRLVHEVWAATSYTSQAFKEFAPVPVLHMPLGVHVERVPAGFARKNPVATLQAFKQAFSGSNRDVGLVIKCMNIKDGDPAWKKFTELASGDERIVIITEVFDRDQVIGLLNCCDVFISLHRAEGFGRCIAEAMLLGKPVIVTNYSGNTDFTHEDTAFLVDGRMVEVAPQEYRFSKGQHWCDPDVGQAAEHMRRCFEDRNSAARIAQAGKEFVLRNYNPAVVGSRYRKRLQELGLAG